jgi:hypothetical protein
MNVLVGCEFSGIVREAFRHEGHEALSIDLLPSEQMGPHIIGDVIEYIKKYGEAYGLMVVHPPCTYIAVSGARWFKDRMKEQEEAIEFVKQLWEAPIPRIAIENPIGVLSTKFRKPDQIIQPWMFGQGETKATCLWLKNLPKLIPTEIVNGRVGRVWKEPPSPNRWKNRSRTYPSIAHAMAVQWGGCV